MHLWITFLTFSGAALAASGVGLIIYDLAFRRRLAVSERVRAMSGEAAGASSCVLFTDLKRLAESAADHELTRSERWQRFIDQSGLVTTTGQVVLWSAALAAAAAAIAGAIEYWLAPIGAVLGATTPWLVVSLKRRRRQRLMCRQLPEAFAMISRAIHAGQTVSAAMRNIADDFESPIADEFALCYEQQNLGMSNESVLRKLASRTGIMELQIFVVSLLVQERSGGDLVGLLNNLASMVRARIKFKNRVRALTGEGRMQANVLIALPVIALLALLVLSPDYVAPLFGRPWLLGATAGAQLVGVVWIRRIVQFDF